MRIIISGGTGVIGKAFVQEMAGHDGEIIILTRDPVRASETFRQAGLMGAQCVAWDGRSADGWGQLVSGETAIINLAGENPGGGRWTAAYKQSILDSRIHTSQAVVQAIERYGPPRLLLQASASGYYGNRGQETLTEDSPPGDNFRADICRQWEAVTANVPTRRCVVRIGIVLHPDSGYFPPMRLFVQMMGRRLGDGRQWIPWIHYQDVARALRFFLDSPSASGTFNVSAPEPATNREFVGTLAKILRRPAVFPMPAWMMRLALGEMATAVLDSERMSSQRLQNAGFQFQYPKLEPALRDMISSS